MKPVITVMIISKQIKPISKDHDNTNGVSPLKRSRAYIDKHVRTSLYQKGFIIAQKINKFKGKRTQKIAGRCWGG